MQYKKFTMQVGISKNHLFDFVDIDCAQLCSGMNRDYVASVDVQITAIDTDRPVSIFDEIRMDGDNRGKVIKNLNRFRVWNDELSSDDLFAKFKRLKTFVPSFVYRNKCVYVLPVTRSYDTNYSGNYPKVRSRYMSGSCIHDCKLHTIPLTEGLEPFYLNEVKQNGKVFSGRWLLQKMSKSGSDQIWGTPRYRPERTLMEFVDPNIAIQGKRFNKLMNEQGWHYISEKGFWANASLETIEHLRKARQELNEESLVLRDRIATLEGQLAAIKSQKEHTI